jgi:hypothetical protein
MAQQVYVSVTPSDSTVYAPALIAIYVGTTGSLKILGKGDTNPVTLPNVAVGWMQLPYPVSQVMAATSATNLFGAAAG